MSNIVSALNGARFDGFAAIQELGPIGMITLRAGPDMAGLADAVQDATGCALPKMREITHAGDYHAGWMSPDEYLLILPYDEVAEALAGLHDHLKGRHYLAVDVSDARAFFRVEGDKAHEVLMKLAPVDHGSLMPNELRRTRLAQAAAAFWRDDAGYSVICFRSVAGYVMNLLRHSAHPGSTLF